MSDWKERETYPALNSKSIFSKRPLEAPQFVGNTEVLHQRKKRVLGTVKESLKKQPAPCINGDDCRPYSCFPLTASLHHPTGTTPTATAQDERINTPQILSFYSSADPTRISYSSTKACFFYSYPPWEFST